MAIAIHTGFKDEGARVAASLRHENLRGVAGVVEHDEQLVVTMEYVPGVSLDLLCARAHEPGSLDSGELWPLALDLLVSAAAGLAYAQERTSMAHGGLSPSKLLILPDGVVKVADFGLSKATSLLTHSGSPLLAPRWEWMSPEQAARGLESARSDVFALGLVLYQLLTGVQPLRRDTLRATRRVAEACLIARSKRHLCGIPRCIEDVLLAALSPSPCDRFPDAWSLKSALERCRDMLRLRSGGDTRGALLLSRLAPELARSTSTFAPQHEALGVGSHVFGWKSKRAPLRLVPGDGMQVCCVQCDAPVRAPSRCSECGAATRAGPFSTTGLIARTHHSRVYRAVGPSGPVALKELLFALAPSTRELDAFAREAALLGELRHPGVPRFVSSFVEGEALQLAREALVVLDHLHSRPVPIVHRDLKPKSLLQRASGELVVVDFGVARRLANGETHEATLVGTPAYMPLEQLGGSVRPTADLYALGATLLHVLTGAPPAPSWGSEPAVDPLEAVRVSRGTRRFIAKLMARKARQRYASALEALEALDALRALGCEANHTSS